MSGWTLPPGLRQRKPRGSWHLLVDFSLLRPGGENGGVKPFAFEYVRWLGRQEGERLQISFLTWSCSHASVRELARPGDNLLCVRAEADADVATIENWRTREWVLLNPPPNLAVELQVDVIYSPQSSAEFFCPGIPAIATIVDLLHREYPLTLGPAEVAHRERVFQQLVAEADAFQCISAYTVEHMAKHYPEAGSRAFRNYIAIHHRLKRAHRRPNSPQVVRPYFLYPANAWPHKNHLTLLVAYRQYREQVGASEAWTLLFTGHQNAAMNDVMSAAAALGLADSVRFEGHVPDERLADIWEHAGALVFPSMHEGFGIPLVEAMHFGIPIICNTATSLPEIAGDAALLADARDPCALASTMRQIAGDPLLRETLVERGRRRLESFSIDAEGAILLDRCRQLRESPGHLYCRGVSPDGWTAPIACIGLPRTAKEATINVTIAAMPAGRRVRLYHGRSPLGGWSVPAATEVRVSAALTQATGPLVIEVPDAANLNPTDHRVHGVMLKAVDVATTGAQGRVHIVVI